MGKICIAKGACIIMEKVKNVLKQFIPPIFVNFMRYLTQHRNLYELEYSPDGWGAALKNSDGWNCKQAIEIENARWASYCETLLGTGPLAFMHEHVNPTEMHESFHNRNITLAYVLALSALGKKTIKILDYGGSLGHSYLFAKAVLPGIHVEFHCKDVPMLVHEGEKLIPAIQWYSDDTCLKNKYDLVIINGVLGYINNWQDFLTEVVPAVSGYLYLGHLPLVNDHQGFVAIQRRYGSEMLHEQFNRKTILLWMEKLGLSLVREFLTGVRPLIKNAPEQCELITFLFRKI
jgi:putative methyltransferase (TIGR04325 family)